MDIGKSIASLDKRLKQVERSARLSHAAIDNTAVVVRDGNGSLRGIIGVQADGTTAVNVVNGAAPPQPSDPVVASVLGGVTAAWDGSFAGGATIPLDWSRVEVHASATAGFTPDASTLQGTIETAQGATVVVPTDVPVYVVLVARNTSGAASTPSTQVGPTGPAPVVANDILDGIVTTVKLADDAVTQAKIAVAAVGSTELAAGAVLEEKLAANAVTTGKLADQVITETKLADDAVTAAKVAVNAIDSAAIQDAAINAAKIGAAAVTAGALASAAVTSGAIANDAVTAGKVAADAITAREVAAGSIATAELAAGAVTANELAANAVVAGKIAANAVTATTIAANAVQTAALAADAVAAGKIAADAITAREIAASAVTASEIAASAVTTAKVAAGAITTDKLVVTGGANILTDPSFEGAYTDSLVAGSTYATRDTAKGNGSPSSLKIDATSGTAVYRSVALTAVPCLPGDQFSIAVDYWVSSDWVGGEVNAHIRWEDATGAVLSYGKAVTTSPTRTAWTRLTDANVTAPANAVTARFRVESGAATAGTVWFDNASLRPVLPGTQIQDGVITTTKIAALTIQAGNIAADAVAAGKIAADAVTAREIAASAVTASEIAANTITTSKLAAGAVDATALAADAITGKTITGGTVTGALIQTAASGQRITLNESSANKILVYNSSGTAIGELSASGLLVKGTTGAVLWLNPSATYPQLLLYNAANTAKATVQVTEPTTGDANLEQFCGPFTGSTYSDMVWRTYLARDFALIERRRASAATVVGGRLYLDPGYSTLGFHNDDNSAQECAVYVEANYAHIDGGRFQVNPPASANSALHANAASGHTGNLLSAALNGVSKFSVDKDGNLTVAGIGQRTAKRRTSDATKTSTTTPATDTQLTWTVDANATYVLDGWLKYSGPGDLLVGWTYPTGTLGEWCGIGNGTTVVSGTGGGGTQQDVSSSWGYTVRTETTDLGSTRTYGGISTNTYGVFIRATIRVSSTGGTFALQWAQGTSNATATTLYTDSHLRLEKVS